MRLSNLLCRAAVVVVSCVTIACTDPAEPEPDPDAAGQVGETQTLPSTLPPPSEAMPRYVGLWAASAEGCADPAWRFEQRRVSTRGEVSCEFQNVTLTDRGYDVQAQCTAEAPPAPYNIQLSFAESARAMMIAGGPWQAGTALVYCGPLPPQ
ncbi:MAG: hypothetical protein AB7T59_14270 [Hyphomonadaceae bacterium]